MVHADWNKNNSIYNKKDAFCEEGVFFIKPAFLSSIPDKLLGSRYCSISGREINNSQQRQHTSFTFRQTILNPPVGSEQLLYSKQEAGYTGKKKEQLSIL